MTGLAISSVVVVALVAALVIAARRRDRADRRRLGLDLPAKPDPVVVDRPFDPELCAYCDEARHYTCRACSRPTCSEHRPWPAHRFCYACEAEWARGERRRSLVIVPIVVASMVVVAGAISAVAVVMDRVNARLGLAAIIVALAIAAPLYGAIDRLLRRRFRPAGTIPTATVRRAP